METESRQCVFVAGMHKSGTSAVAGALSQCGFALGDELMPPQEENPKGFFENMALYRLNERILSDLGHRWNSMNPVTARRLLKADTKRYQREVRQTVQSNFPNDRPILIKDPRLCLLFPFYRRVVDRRITVVLTSRPIEDIYRSLHRRSGMSRLRAYVLTKLYNYFVGVNTKDLEADVHLIDFDQFLASPVRGIQSITASLTGVSVEPRQIEEFVEPDLNRSRTASDTRTSTRIQATSRLASWWVQSCLGTEEPILYSE